MKSRVETIKIQEDSSFVNETTVVFSESDLPRLYPIFYDTELEEVSDIQLFEKKGRRLKKISIKKIIEEEVDLDYITSKKIKSIVIPAEKEVVLKYLVSCKELMYFASLPFFSYNSIDTLQYKIKVPDNFGLRHNTIYKDSLSFYQIDSTKVDNARVWDIKVSPKKVEPDPLQFFGIYKNMKVPLMRTLVTTSSYKGQPVKYMNDWYFNIVMPQKGLNVAVKQKIDELTSDINDSSEIVKVLYDYVRQNFKYVAIEIGMGAFIPSHANDVYLNKQGDCKDLSNFLSEALLYKGIKSDIALAATFDHISDCDFPSLSSANHVICVAYLNNEKVLLDPTDPIHSQGTPVQSLQDRTIFIVNSEGGSFYKVNRFDPRQNKIDYQLDLTIHPDNNFIEGSFEIDYNGISDNYLRRILDSEAEKDFKEFSKTHFEEVLGNNQISNLVVTNKSKGLDVKGNITIIGKTFGDSDNQYLFIDFLPRLIETETRETLIAGTYLWNPFQKKVSAKIKLNEPIEVFEPIEYNYEGEGVSLQIIIKSISNLELECNYDFIFDHIFIDKINIIPINEILESFKNIINEPILLKKQNR
ncbi:transglutaminase-like domain-containing protein [Winogradskyella sp.]|uniref:transglutaminase-like domain-containing protein n=1 Tax=Winogradskyella sp. TaxID=1883156 RepID=UPI001B21A2F5|nr:transglutaminase-like domain-containing protein [Winogradskyella sp.]MBO6880523.1 transglutaminase domain-containing protein [Winogradskyella sp.]